MQASRAFADRLLGKLLHRLGVSSDPRSFRRGLFRAILVLSAASSLNGTLWLAKTGYRPEYLLETRVLYGVWAVLHFPIYLLWRRRPDIAHLVYLCGCVGVIGLGLRGVDLAPVGVIGAGYTFHVAFLLLGVLTLSRRRFIIYSATTTGAICVIVSIIMADLPLGALVGMTTPLVGCWALSVAASIFMDRNFSLIAEYQDELNRHREDLEAQVEERTRTIEEQQRHLRQSEKLTALGTLAGGIAHDFNNMLTGILGSANMLRLQSDPSDEAREAAEIIESAANRASKLTRQLLGFARKGKLENRAVDIHAVVGEVCSLLSRTIDKRITLIQRYGAKSCIVLGDPTQLHQVLFNVAVNARDAMEEGGELRFETRIEERGQAGDDAIPPGRYVVVAVRDTGKGIDPEAIEHIFDPFFTTREDGTGMGLAMAHGIVHNHGGTIEVESQVGVGTTFDIYLPVSEVPVTKGRDPERREIVHGTGRILLVDDEAMVRKMLGKMLEYLGYDVETVDGGAVAITEFGRNPKRYDLVLLDLTMPRMGGCECLRGLREKRKDVVALIATGHGLDGAVQEALDEGAVGFVQKPCSLSALSVAVAKALR